ncbi:MAG: hypothetical protein ACI8ZM_003014 [Crocinitomix sp.]|jgi:hypothetical protein
MKVKSLFLTLLLVHAYQAFCQDNSAKSNLTYLTAFNGGFCSSDQFCAYSSGNSYLKLSDTVLIAFNEHSTYEDRLNLKGAGIILDTGYYHVLFIDAYFGRVDSVEVYAGPNVPNGYTDLKFNFFLCFQGQNKRFVHFESTSLNIVETFCNNTDSISATMLTTDSQYELSGITSEDFPEELASQRTLLLYYLLVDKGVPENRLIIHESIALDSIPKRNLYGYFGVYPPDDNDGIFNNECKQGVQIKELIRK